MLEINQEKSPDQHSGSDFVEVPPVKPIHKVYKNCPESWPIRCMISFASTSMVWQFDRYISFCIFQTFPPSRWGFLFKKTNQRSPKLVPSWPSRTHLLGQNNAKSSKSQKKMTRRRWTERRGNAPKNSKHTVDGNQKSTWDVFYTQRKW